MNSEPTVEECLVELRGLFPLHWIYIDLNTDSSLSPLGKQTILNRAEIQIDHKEGKVVYCDAHMSLSEAMNQVRQWHKENKANG
jgi:hypothetical protein